MIKTGFDNLGAIVGLTSDDLKVIENAGPIVLAGHKKTLIAMAETLTSLGLKELKKIKIADLRAPMRAKAIKIPATVSTASIPNSQPLQTMIHEWLNKNTGQDYSGKLRVKIEPGPPISATVNCVKCQLGM
jgi:hypothetical protein